MADTLQQIPIEKIGPSPFNPRKAFPEAELAELADSIRVQGVIEPLLVREVSTNGPGSSSKTTPYFEIVAGERRYRAALAAGLKSLPAIVRELTDVAARELQIIENLQRADIGPLEEAAAYQDLLKAAGDAKQPLTVKKLAARAGKSERYVYARIELLALDGPAQKALVEGKISAGHAQELVPLNRARQLEMLKDLLSPYNQPMSVQDLREEIKYRYAPKPGRRRRPSSRKKSRPNAPPKPSAAPPRMRAGRPTRRNTDRDRKVNELAAERVSAALWPKLKLLPAAKLIPLLIELLIEDSIGDTWRMRQAAKIAGKGAPRLPFAALVAFQTRFDFYGKPHPAALALAKHCGIDPAAIRKAAAAELAPPAKASPTSAKARKPRTPKQTARRKKRAKAKK